MNPTLPALLAAALASPALAQWSVTILHPQGTPVSQLSSEDSSAQVGSIGPSGFQHAARWNGYASSMTDIHPPNAARSQAAAVDLGDIVGEELVYPSGSAQFHALLWRSGSNTPIDLHPGNATDSSAYAVSSGRQGGYIYLSQLGYRACIWSGSAGSCTLIHPAGADYSYVNGMDATSQVGTTVLLGSTNSMASLWHSTAASWVNLNPSGATASAAVGVDAGQQVGEAQFAGRWHAYLWQGTPQSGVDLHPVPTYIESEAIAVDDGVQVGYTKTGFNSPFHAALWRGSAATWVDLHSFISPTYTWSCATGVIHDGPRVRVSGWVGTTFDSRKAIIWTQVVCSTADFDGDGDVGTDADIEAFFACLAGRCCATCWSGGGDFNGDGDAGTDADIEAFFRVLAGQPC